MCLQMTQFHSFLWLNNIPFAFLFAEMILSFLNTIPPSLPALMLRFGGSSLTTVRASPEHLIWLGMVGHWAYDTPSPPTNVRNVGWGRKEEADTLLITLEGRARLC